MLVSTYIEPNRGAPGAYGDVIFVDGGAQEASVKDIPPNPWVKLGIAADR